MGTFMLIVTLPFGIIGYVIGAAVEAFVGGFNTGRKDLIAYAALFGKEPQE